MFYCLQHYDSRLSAPTAKKRPAPSDRTSSHRTSVVRTFCLNKDSDQVHDQYKPAKS
ncbi:protein-methionine sulfoxide oxidase mical3b-like isoform X2, partial [Scomber scombrus]